MVFLGLGILGVIMGAVGSEFLRVLKPDFVKQIEESARDYVGRLGLPGSREKGSPDKPRG